MPPPPAAAPHGEWIAAGAGSGGGAGWTLRLAGDWRGLAHARGSGNGSAAALPPPPPRLLADPGAALRVDAAALAGWDTRLAALLWQRLTALAGRAGAPPPDLSGLPTGLQRVLALALRPATGVPPTAPAASPSTGPADPSAPSALPAPPFATAPESPPAFAETRTTLEFVGAVLLALAAWLRGRGAMRASDLAWQIEQTGPRSLPIVALVGGLVALILAYMGAAQLVRFGAQTFIADLVTIGVVRELAALVVGIVLAGRIGAAFAAQLGSMRANEELDALRTLGLDPVGHLVLPRVLAMALAGPLLTAFAAAVGIAMGWAVAVLVYDLTPLEYAVASAQALTLPHVAVGLLKGTVYALLVALAGCRQGLAAGRSAQAVGEATTRAVVQSIVWIAVAASLLTVIFQRLDI